MGVYTLVRYPLDIVLSRLWPPDVLNQLPEWLVRAVENCSRDDRDLVVTGSTLKQYGTNGPRFLMTTVRTTEPIRPPQLIKIV